MDTKHDPITEHNIFPVGAVTGGQPVYNLQTNSTPVPGVRQCSIPSARCCTRTFSTTRPSPRHWHFYVLRSTAYAQTDQPPASNADRYSHRPSMRPVSLYTRVPMERV